MTTKELVNYYMLVFFVFCTVSCCSCTAINFGAKREITADKKVTKAVRKTIKDLCRKGYIN